MKICERDGSGKIKKKSHVTGKETRTHSLRRKKVCRNHKFMINCILEMKYRHTKVHLGCN